MFITGLGTAAPPRRYTQLQCWEALAASNQFARLTTRSRAILKKVLAGKNGIASRHLALDPLTEAFDISPDALHARFTRHAPALAEEAARHALAEAGTSVNQIDAILISTCTGYLCPGLTSYVSERLGLRGDVMALDLVGQGCGAALPNLRAAAGLLRSGQAERVLSVCVEVCSAAFFLDDDPGVLISACLFGDGAAAAVLRKTPRPSGRKSNGKTAAQFSPRGNGTFSGLKARAACSAISSRRAFPCWRPVMPETSSTRCQPDADSSRRTLQDGFCTRAGATF